MISPLQTPPQPAAWILQADGSALPATGMEGDVMGKSGQTVPTAFAEGSVLPMARRLLEQNVDAISPPLLLKAETFILNSSHTNSCTL